MEDCHQLYGWLFPKDPKHFSERHPSRHLKKSVVSTVVIATPHNTSGAQWTPSIMVDEVKWLDRKVASFELINNSGYATDGLFGSLIKEKEIQARLDFLTDRTLEAAKKYQ